LLNKTRRDKNLSRCRFCGVLVPALNQAFQQSLYLYI